MKKIAIVFLVCAAVALYWLNRATPLPAYWSESELALIQSLSLSQLPPLPADPSNAVADLESAAEFGRLLYFDTRLSSNGNVACASCHQPGKMFTDGLPLAVAVGVGTRHTPSLVGVAYSPWFYWDGRKDSQWSQALAPLESPIEHNISREQLLRLIASDADYRNRYQSVFGPLPIIAEGESGNPGEEFEIDRAFSNIGKALAAYQRKLQPGRSRFDDYADSISSHTDIAGDGSLSTDELKGLSLFIDKAQCVHCHNGPLFTNHEFHNTGILSSGSQLPSMGRYDGIRIVREDPFNCLGEFSDAQASDCVELRFARDDNSLVGAHKTPTLRNVAATAPYMHSGQIADLRQVLIHYNEAPESMLSHNEAKPLGLGRAELRELEAFLLTLSAPLATGAHWLSVED